MSLYFYNSIIDFAIITDDTFKFRFISELRQFFSKSQQKLLYWYYNKECCKLCWLLSKDPELMYCQVCAFCMCSISRSHPHCKASSLPTYKPTFTSICLVFPYSTLPIWRAVWIMVWSVCSATRYCTVCVINWRGTALQVSN